MGCNQSVVKDGISEQVDEEIRAAKEIDKAMKKLLLLGTGGAGKSTLFKQLQNLYDNGFQSQDRKNFRSQIHEQIIEAMKNMVIRAAEFVEDQIPNAQNCLIYQLKKENQPYADKILTIRVNQELTSEIATCLGILWKDPAIRAMFEIRNRICVPDSTSYFLDSLDRIITTDYIPNEKDLLLVRYRTTGMAEKEYTFEGSKFKICDVGGQCNERRKWIHFFDGVTAVIFVVASSSYDEVTFEDENANSMIEAMGIFDEQLNSHWFENTSFILFLNKNDIFENKIRKVPITVCFPKYHGPQEYQPSLDYIRDQFNTLNKKPDDKQIYTHVTCATDIKNVERVFNDIQHIVINSCLDESGFV